MAYNRSLPSLLAALFGAMAMIGQTLLLRRFLWRFEATESGVALFLAAWLLWYGVGAGLAATRRGRQLAEKLSTSIGVLLLCCVALYFLQYHLLVNLRAWMGLADYEAFPVTRLALGCLLANAPFCFVSGWVIPALGHSLRSLGLPISRVFAWEALGAAVGGALLITMLSRGVAIDPRDKAEWFRFFPDATQHPKRMETSNGTTFYGEHGCSFYALTSNGAMEVLPESENAMDLAALALSQRPQARKSLLLGDISLNVALAINRLNPDTEVLWAPCDAVYGQRLLTIVAPEISKIVASTATPQMLLQRAPSLCFDLVMVAPPAAATLEGALWRESSFLEAVRRVTTPGGAMFFQLDCEAATMTEESAHLIALTMQRLRMAWTDGGMLAAGAGGWWIASPAGGEIADHKKAAVQFASIHKESVYPAAAVELLYDERRAKNLAKRCPALDISRELNEPSGAGSLQEMMAAGLAHAIRLEYPWRTPLQWLRWFEQRGGALLLGLALLVLCLAPVVAGSPSTSLERLLALCISVSGALGLVISLSLMYVLQMRFGALYLLAGAGSCLYFCGLFLGNHFAQFYIGGRVSSLGSVRLYIALIGVVQIAVAGLVCWLAHQLSSGFGVIALCFPVGIAGGLIIPCVIKGFSFRGDKEVAAKLVLSDTLGAAVAGVFFVILVPLAGLGGAIAIFCALSLVVGLCVLIREKHIQLAATIALLAALLVMGGKLRHAVPTLLEGTYPKAISAAPRESIPGAGAKAHPSHRRGIPRRVNVKEIERQMRDGQLSTHPALWVEGEK